MRRLSRLRGRRGFTKRQMLAFWDKESGDQRPLSLCVPGIGKIVG